MGGRSAGRVSGRYAQRKRTIFPNKRAPFQTGTYETRISAVKTLGEVLATFTTQPTLVTLSGTLLGFYNTLETARTGQTGKELGISGNSDQLEQQRLACCTAMYGTLGKLMYKFRTTPCFYRKLLGYEDTAYCIG